MDPHKVDLMEYERGYGSRIDGSKFFSNREEARKWQNIFNSKNDKAEVPDWYMVASTPYRCSQDEYEKNMKDVVIPKPAYNSKASDEPILTAAKMKEERSKNNNAVVDMHLRSINKRILDHTGIDDTTHYNASNINMKIANSIQDKLLKAGYRVMVREDRGTAIGSASIAFIISW